MPEEQLTEHQKSNNKGFSLTQKIMFVIAGIFVVGAIYWVLTGGINNIYQVVIIIVLGLFLSGLIYLVIKAVQIVTTKKMYSPKDDFYTRLTTTAILSKPDNLNDLYFCGDIGKKRYRAGEIIGCMQLPHLVGKIKKDKNGNPEYYESEKLKQKMPRFEKVFLGEDKDTFLIIEKGFLFKKRINLRCDSRLHSTLNGDVEVYDVNPVPYGSFFQYPLKQMQRDAPRIMMQNQLEIMMMTHEYQYDLISKASDIGFNGNPVFRMAREEKRELSSEQ